MLWGPSPQQGKTQGSPPNVHYRPPQVPGRDRAADNEKGCTNLYEQEKPLLQLLLAAAQPGDPASRSWGAAAAKTADRCLRLTGSGFIVVAVTRFNHEHMELQSIRHEWGTLPGFVTPSGSQRLHWINTNESQKEGDGQDLPKINHRRAQ